MADTTTDLMMDIAKKEVFALAVIRAARVDKALKAAGIRSDLGIDLAVAKLAGKLGWEFISENLAVAKSIVAGGSISVGGTQIDANGLELSRLSQSILTSNDNDLAASSRITPLGVVPNFRGSFSFYTDATGSERGTEIVQSVGDNYAARVLLMSRKAGTGVTDLQNSYVRVQRNVSGSPDGEIQLQGLLSGRTMIDAQYQSGWLSLAAGASRTYTHGLGAAPLLWAVLASVNSDGSGSFPVPNAASTMTITSITATDIIVANSTSGTRYVRVSAWKDPYP